MFKSLKREEKKIYSILLYGSLTGVPLFINVMLGLHSKYKNHNSVVVVVVMVVCVHVVVSYISPT